jgi:hypothetical protein
MVPWNAGPALQRGWAVADFIWEAAGDTAEDYNRYSKRGLLTAILPPIVLYWLDNPSEEDLDEYISRRLAQASGADARQARSSAPFLTPSGQKGPIAERRQTRATGGDGLQSIFEEVCRTKVYQAPQGAGGADGSGVRDVHLRPTRQRWLCAGAQARPKGGQIAPIPAVSVEFRIKRRLGELSRPQFALQGSHKQRK